MSTVAEIKAAIEELPLEERGEIKLYLRQCIAKDWTANTGSRDEPKQKPQAPLGATSL